MGRRWPAPTGARPARSDPLAGLCERLSSVREALLHFLDRRARALVLVFDVRGDGPAVGLDELEDLADRRVPLAPDRVVALVLLAILEVDVRDVGVVFADVG